MHLEAAAQAVGGKHARGIAVEAQRGGWDCAADWTPVWVAFGPSWRRADEPLPWEAHRALWQVLDAFADQVRFHRRLGGVIPLLVPEDAAR